MGPNLISLNQKDKTTSKFLQKISVVTVCKQIRYPSSNKDSRRPCERKRFTAGLCYNGLCFRPGGDIYSCATRDVDIQIP